MDSRCAHLFVDDELSVNIVPAGVDILRELARACDEVRARLPAVSFRVLIGRFERAFGRVAGRETIYRGKRNRIFQNSAI